MEQSHNTETISRLKFIGKIKPGEKINLRNMALQSNSFIIQILRTIFQDDNRSKTLLFLQDTIIKSFDLIKFYEEFDNITEKFVFNNIINDLINAKNGLVNLKKTYAEDIKFICDLDVIIQMINLKLCYYNINDVDAHLDGIAATSNNDTIE
jgi:hypothetical protein